MRELSLFTGCGGGLLGSRLLGWRTVGYVEREPYRCRVLAQRIADGILDDSPIYCGDVREFIRGGYADCYAGLVEVVSAGFPCQPFSQAGLQMAGADERNCWPQTIEIIRRIHPRFGWFENVPGLLRLAYWQTIRRDIADAGYGMRYCILGGEDVGAPHVRKRLWILAHSDQARCHEGRPSPPGQESRPALTGESGAAVANASHDNGGGGEPSTETGTRTNEQRRRGLASGCVDWWRDDPAERGQTTFPHVDRVVDGLAHRVDRLGAIGDGQIPAVVAAAWRKLMNEQPTQVMENAELSD